MKKIAVDLGSSTTKIYMPGCGVVLTEATCIAVEEYVDRGEKQLKIKAYGDRARALYGKSAVNTHIVNPVFEGDIVHKRLAAVLLEYFLEKVEITPRKARKTEVLFVLPCDASAELRQKYAYLAAECGFGAAYFTVTPFAAVLGHNVWVGESNPVFSVDIGSSITNIAAFSRDGLIAGITVNLGGGNIDVHLIDYLAENFNLKIGALSSERLKNTAGSLLDNDNKVTVVDGRELSGGAPASIAVNSGQIYDVIATYIDKIIEYILLVLGKLPAEVSSAVMHGGIFLSGGVLKMDGLAEYIGKKLNIPVNLPEEVQLAPVIGGGTIFADDDMFESLAYEL